MQQPAPTPAPAPIAPAQAPAPTAVVNLPDGPLPLEGLPRNAQELRGLRERREILRDQLERATNRRGQLVAQLDRDGPAAVVRVGTQQRLAMLDDRILQIEREQATTERLLANAPPGVLAQTAEPPRNRPMVDEDDAIAGAFAAFFFGIVLTIVVSRVRRRLARRRGGARNATATAALADDPRFERLAQAVDAMSEEVERIGEGQRFVTQLLAERREPAALSAEPRR